MKIKTSHQWQTGSIHRIYFQSIITGGFFEINYHSLCGFHNEG